MIYDILDVFEKQYEDKGDKLILDNYMLKDGLYVKINKDGTLNYYIFKDSKNENVKDYCFKDLNDNINTSMYQWFKERDYYSGYLNSNKAFSDKKIHNINYLSLFVKLESFTTKDKKKKILPNAIEKQYKELKTYEKFKKKQEIDIINSFKDKINDQTRLSDIDAKYDLIEKNRETIIEIAKEYKIKNYIKIFFDEYIGKYKKESSFYYAIKIFNDINYRKTLGNDAWGPSDSNFGLNESKKPFLRSMTKMNNIPFLITDENALMLKRFFDWLSVQDYKESFPLKMSEDGKSIFIGKHSKDGQTIIDDFDYIPTKEDKLEKSIYFKNHLMLKNRDMGFLEDNTIDLLWELEEKIDEIFYNNQLKNNYYNEVYKKLDKSFQNLIYITRAGMVNYFRKQDDRAFYKIIIKYGNDFIFEHIKKERIWKAGISLNLKFSLLANKGEYVMDIIGMKQKIIGKLEASNYDMLSGEEFFYLSGQVVKYLIGQSESHEKKGNMLEPFLRCNNAKKLKRDIEFIYFKYKHKISLNFVNFNNSLSLIMAYDGNEKLRDNMDAFLVGALSDNLFYAKK